MGGRRTGFLRPTPPAVMPSTLGSLFCLGVRGRTWTIFPPTKALQADACPEAGILALRGAAQFCFEQHKHYECVGGTEDLRS